MSGQSKKKSTSPGRGGKRPGAGRKKAVQNAAKKLASTKAIELAHKDGESPLEYMLRTMRQTDDDLIEMENKGLIDTEKRIFLQIKRNEDRKWGAQQAAPYVHPKLTAIEHKGDPDNPIKQEWTIRVVDATRKPAEVGKK